ncbi:MAG: hypothetical protein R3D00_17755 [Bacteroidia bacterium]
MNLRLIFATFFFFLSASGHILGQKKPEGWECRLSGNDSVMTVFLDIHDPIICDQVLITGLTLWIAPDGKKKAIRGIHYPLGLPEDARTNDPGVLLEQRSNIHNAFPDLPGEMRHLELVNFYGEGEYTWGENQNPGSIQTTIQAGKNKTLHYQALIPVELIFGKQAELYREGREKHFTLGFETGKLGRPLIRGDMGVGMGMGSQATVTGSYDRLMQNMLEDYRAFTVPAAFELKKQQLPATDK